jgi:hypothetical protein
MTTIGVRNRIAKILFLCLLLFPLSIYGQEKIELYIDGQKYIREYPATLDEARDLIDSLVSINNDLDKSFLEYQRVTENEENVLLDKLKVLEFNNGQLQEQLNNTRKTLAEVSSYVNQKTSLLLSINAGPSFGMSGNALGHNIGAGILKRIDIFNLINLYVGLNVNTTIYYLREQNKVQDVAVGLYLGFFLN